MGLLTGQHEMELLTHGALKEKLKKFLNDAEKISGNRGRWIMMVCKISAS